MNSEFSFKADGKNVRVYPASLPDSPIVYLNTFEEEGARVHGIMQNCECDEITLVTVTNLSWESDLSPWECEHIVKEAAPFEGCADDFLRLLTEKIVPRVEENLGGSISWRGIAGYSMAGLFAVYSLYKTDIFSRIASVSGSLWFPGFRQFVFERELKAVPEKMYFSVGDKEHRSKNTYLKTVQENTEQIAEFFKDKNIDVFFELNPGNHFERAAERMAAGIMQLI